MSGHAVTPSATRGLPSTATPEQMKALGQACDIVRGQIGEKVAEAAEHDARLVGLALQLADECARADIESVCFKVTSGGRDWYDTCSVGGEDLDFVDRALKYFALRGYREPAFHVVRCKAFPSLVRFEDLP